MVQYRNMRFVLRMRTSGGRYRFRDQEERTDESDDRSIVEEVKTGDDSRDSVNADHALKVGQEYPPPEEVMKWVKQTLIRNRGQDVLGNFNPLLISELFWEQSDIWRLLTMEHTEQVAELCEKLVEHLLCEIAPEDISTKLLGLHIEDQLKHRLESAREELAKIVADTKRHPITMTMQKMRAEDFKAALSASIQAGTKGIETYNYIRQHISNATSIDQSKIIFEIGKTMELSMDKHSCNDVLKSLTSFYEVSFVVLLSEMQDESREGCAQNIYR
jgi:hypothetical protein